jgi:hypothetical protein
LTVNTAAIVALRQPTANEPPEKQQLSDKGAWAVTLYLPTEIQIPLGSVNK